MKLCTDKVVADWLALTPKRVKQLRDMGVLIEKSPGLYDLRASVLRYVNYVRKGKRADLQDERALLAKAKRETAEMDNALRRGELHKTEELESGIKTILLNFRSRVMVLPAKEAPKLAQLGGDQGKIFDEFAERHNVDGVDALIVLEDVDVREHAAHWEAGAKQNFDTGLYDSYRILYISVEDYGEMPQSGDMVTIDEGTKDQQLFTLKSCEDENGIYRMILERVRQG